MNNKEARCKEFLSCLGNGKDIYQCEIEKPKNKVKIEIPLPKIITALELWQLNLKQQEAKKMQKQELISQFKNEMQNLNLTFFAPTHPKQFRVELGIVADRGGHIYADFLNEIQTKQDLDEFIKKIKSELKAMKELRARIAEGNFDEEAYALEQYG